MEGELSGKQFPLPAEIIVIILSMLPVKSLIRFKCVSRPWRSLISSANFITLHTQKAADNRQVFLQRRRVMFNPPRFRLSLYSINLDQFLHDNAHHPYNASVTPTELNLFWKEFAPQIRPGGFPPLIIDQIHFCNNLLLCDVDFKLYLVNPGTRELKKVPEKPAWRPRPPERRRHLQGLCGLGFDDTTNDYKVVHGQMYEDCTIFYSVYTLRDDSWRHIESHSRYRPAFNKPGIFLKGAIHWYAFKSLTNGGNRPVILTFRLDKEEFDEIQLPRVRHIRSSKLGVFRDCLCITFTGDQQLFDEFWVMKEYRSSESWTKVSLPRPYTGWLTQIGFSTESHDVMIYYRSLVTYKGFGEEHGKLQIRGDIPHTAGVYVEGLYPLNSTKI